jgi:hypothetical protein
VSDPKNKPQETLDRVAENLAQDVLNDTYGEILAEAKEGGRDIVVDTAGGRAICAQALAAQGKH